MVQAIGTLLLMGAGEERALPPFDFSNALVPGETIVTATCQINLLRGTDLSPQSRLIVGPTVNPIGNQVSVLIGMLRPYASYQIIITVTTSLGQILDLWAVQQCAGP